MSRERLATLGQKERSLAALPPVSLAEVVPPDHVSRHRERSLNRSFVRDLVREAYVERGRGDHATEPSARAMRNRQVWVEPRFAEATGWHGLRRYRLLGLGAAPVPERVGERRLPATLTPVGPAAVTAAFWFYRFGRLHRSAHRVPFFQHAGALWEPERGRSARTGMSGRVI